jgi:predicted lipoprotein with Yx(FWY)xxD motif
MSLYTFDSDSDGSACNGPCVANWPVLKAEASDQPGDNCDRHPRRRLPAMGLQGKPLYTFVKDQKASDITGDGSSTAHGSGATLTDLPQGIARGPSVSRANRS